MEKGGKKRSKVLVAVSYIMAALFLLSMLVQYNDPDALVWMILYGVAGLACLLYSLNRLPWCVPAVVAVVALVWAVVLLPDVIGRASWNEIFESMQMRSDAVEEAREAGGLLIVALWMGVLAWALRREREHVDRAPA